MKTTPYGTPDADGIVHHLGRRIEVTTSYPLELHYIKALFVQRQFRQCMGACNEIKSMSTEKTPLHPVHVAYLNFYLALSHEALGRLMHDYSQAKISSLEHAEKFYREAMDALPIPERQTPSARKYSGAASSPEPTVVCYASDSQADYSDDDSMSPPRTSSEFVVGARNAHIKVGITSAPRSSMNLLGPVLLDSFSDESDPLSESDFDEIMTPSRVLRRDISRKSLHDAPAAPRVLPKPIRLGSPPKQYHVPLKMLTARALQSPIAQRPSRLPVRPETPSKGSHLEPVTEEPRLSDSSGDISPVSPTHGSPVKLLPDWAPTPTASPEPANTGIAWSGSRQSFLHHRSVARYNQHLLSMQNQTTTHLFLLRKAKQQTIDAQQERASSRATSAPISKTGSHVDSNGRRTFSAAHVQGNTNGVPQSRSYWSFTSADVKQTEKQKHIQAGRERVWIRERFQPRKYMDLAELALSEL